MRTLANWLITTSCVVETQRLTAKSTMPTEGGFGMSHGFNESKTSQEVDEAGLFVIRQDKLEGFIVIFSLFSPFFLFFFLSQLEKNQALFRTND